MTKIIENKINYLGDNGFKRDLKQILRNFDCRLDKFEGYVDKEKGYSAYEIWLQQGNTGTEQDFLNSLKGKDGKSVLQLFQEIPGNEDATIDDLLAYLKGPKGDDGDKGDKGDPGKNGDKGDTGDTGAPGPKGDPGDTGKSAYQIWLDEGNTGTEEDFLNSLKGGKGDKGDTGAPGKDGTDATLNLEDIAGNGLIVKEDKIEIDSFYYNEIASEEQGSSIIYKDQNNSSITVNNTIQNIEGESAVSNSSISTGGIDESISISSTTNGKGAYLSKTLVYSGLNTTVAINSNDVINNTSLTITENSIDLNTNKVFDIQADEGVKVNGKPIVTSVNDVVADANGNVVIEAGGIKPENIGQGLHIDEKGILSVGEEEPVDMAGNIYNMGGIIPAKPMYIETASGDRMDLGSSISLSSSSKTVEGLNSSVMVKGNDATGNGSMVFLSTNRAKADGTTITETGISVSENIINLTVNNDGNQHGININETSIKARGKNILTSINNTQADTDGNINIATGGITEDSIGDGLRLENGKVSVGAVKEVDLGFATVNFSGNIPSSQSTTLYEGEEALVDSLILGSIDTATAFKDGQSISLIKSDTLGIRQSLNIASLEEGKGVIAEFKQSGVSLGTVENGRQGTVMKISPLGVHMIGPDFEVNNKRVVTSVNNMTPEPGGNVNIKSEAPSLKTINGGSILGEGNLEVKTELGPEGLMYIDQDNPDKMVVYGITPNTIATTVIDNKTGVTTAAQVMGQGISVMHNTPTSDKSTNLQPGIGLEVKKSGGGVSETLKTSISSGGLFYSKNSSDTNTSCAYSDSGVNNRTQITSNNGRVDLILRVSPDILKGENLTYYNREYVEANNHIPLKEEKSYSLGSEGLYLYHNKEFIEGSSEISINKRTSITQDHIQLIDQVTGLPVTITVENGVLKIV